MAQGSRTAPAVAFAVATLGIAVFSWMDAVMKGLSLAIGTYNALFWRGLASVAISGAAYAFLRAPWPTRAAMRLHVIRGVVSTAMAVLFFWGLARVPMAQAIALAFIAPLIALFLAAVILKETIGRTTIVASAIAFAGVVTILIGQWRSELGPDALRGALAVLASAICYAFNIILMRAQSLVADVIEVTFWQSLIVTACLTLAAPWFAVLPRVEHAPAIGLAALFVTLSLALLSWAYARGEASYLAPSEYTAFVWASALGFVVFGEHLSPWTVTGALLIVVGCALAARRSPPPPVSEGVL